jgi:hypothetical protein
VLKVDEGAIAVYINSRTPLRNSILSLLRNDKHHNFRQSLCGMWKDSIINTSDVVRRG